MKKLWITYSWDDNKDGDVDFMAQEIEKKGIIVKLDKWNINAGKRLWEQIERFIINPDESDAWSIYATQNSLGSEPCKEEVAYALDRALNTRGAQFPLIGIFPSTVEKELIPASIRTRLYVSLLDEDWLERIKATIENRDIEIKRPNLEPYALTKHKINNKYAIEIRPRAGVWSPFFCAIPAKEKEKINPKIFVGPKGVVQTGGIKNMSKEGYSDNKEWWFMSAENEATPTRSYYLICNEIPTKIAFGVFQSNPNFLIEIKNSW